MGTTDVRCVEAPAAEVWRMDSSKEQYAPIRCSYSETRPPETLVPNPRNPNRHSPRQIELLAKIIDHQGWRNPIVVSTRSGFVVSGHGRLAAALLLKLPVVPVDLQQFESEADEWAHLIADNRIAELADMDEGGLADLLRDLGDVEGLDLDITGFDGAALDKLLADDGESDDIADGEGGSEQASLLKFDGISIPLTQAEKDALRRRIDDHSDATGSHFGFVRQLLNLDDDGGYRLPPGLVYFDYTAAGEPALCMQRRTPATTITINPANVTVGEINIAPRLDLQVEELKVFFARRETVGDKRLTVWDSETAGALTTGLPRRQPALISGPEVDTYLPQDFTDSVVVRSSPLRDTFGRVKGEVFAQFDERLKAAGAINFGVGTFSAATIGGGTFNLKSIPTTVTDSEGNPVDPAFNRYLIVGESRDWWTKDGIEHVKARISATIYTRVVYDIPGTATPPAWADIMGSQVYGFVHASGTQSSAVYATTVSVPVTLVKTDWAVDTTLIRAEDYAFVQPPAGLAANLLATQNWLPYEGSVGPIAIGDIPAGNLVGSVLNLSGFLSETANMRALISGYTVRPAAGTVTFRLGAPSRFAYRDLANRFRQSGADNIVWLVDSVSGDPGENPPPDPELEIPAGPDFSILYTDSFLVFDGDFIAFTP